MAISLWLDTLLSGITIPWRNGYVHIYQYENEGIKGCEE